jgi:hypothetical protein
VTSSATPSVLHKKNEFDRPMEAKNSDTRLTSLLTEKSK